MALHELNRPPPGRAREKPYLQKLGLFARPQAAAPIAGPRVGRPGRVNPAAGRPGRVNPAVGRPGRANPAVSRLSRANPAVSRPSRVNPAVSRLGRVNPAVGRLGRVNPAMGRLGRVNPAVSRPSRVNPAVGRPSRVNPAVSRLGRVNPAVGRLSRVNPAVSRLSRVNPAVGRLGRVNPAVSRLSRVNPAVSPTPRPRAGTRLENPPMSFHIISLSFPYLHTTRSKNCSGAEADPGGTEPGRGEYPVRVPSAAFNVRLPSRSVGSPKETANTPFPVRSRLPAGAGPCTPHYVVVQIKCRRSVSGGRIPGPAACFHGICRGQFASPPPPKLGAGRDLKSPSDGEDGARNGGGEVCEPTKKQARPAGSGPGISRPIPANPLRAIGGPFIQLNPPPGCACGKSPLYFGPPFLPPVSLPAVQIPPWAG